MNKKFIFYLSCILLQMGCAELGPSKLPSMTTPSEWTVKNNKTKIVTSEQNTKAWWEKFDDKLLNQLVSEVLRYNNDLHMATGNIMKAEASLKKAHASWLPTIDIGATAFKGELGVVKENPVFALLPISKPKNTFVFDGYAAGFIPSYSLNILEQIKLGEVAHLNLAMQVASKNAVRLALISQATAGYFSLLGLKKQLALHQQMISDTKQLRNLMRVQCKHGATSPLRVASLDQSIDMLEKKTPLLQHDIISTQNALNVLRDKNSGAVPTASTMSTINTHHIIPINLPSEILKTRPDIMIAAYELHASHEMLGMSISKLFPAINLTSLLGSASLELSNLVTMGKGFTFGEVAGKLPGLNFGLLADIDKSRGDKYIAFYHYISTVRHAFAEVDDALSQHSAMDDSVEQTTAAFHKAQEQYHIAHIQYQQGKMSYAEALAYKLNVDYMASVLNETQMKQVESIVALYQALGAGNCNEGAFKNTREIVSLDSTLSNTK